MDSIFDNRSILSLNTQYVQFLTFMFFLIHFWDGEQYIYAPSWAGGMRHFFGPLVAFPLCFTVPSCGCTEKRNMKYSLLRTDFKCSCFVKRVEVKNGGMTPNK